MSDSKDDLVAFDRASAERTDRAVNEWEKSPQRLEAAGFSGDASTGDGSFWAKLTGSYDQSTGYPWKLQKPSSNGKSLVDFTPAIVGVRFFAEDGDTSLAAGRYVKAWPSGADEQGNACWRFIKGGGDQLPTPTAQYQVLQVTRFASDTDYDIDWGYVRAHS